MMRWVIALLMWFGPVAANAEPVRVHAAASLTEVVTALETAWRDAGGAPWRVSLAASSTLARQIDAGAPADLLLSANRSWVDWLVERGRVEPGGVRAFAGNALVLIAPSDPASAVPAPAPVLERETLRDLLRSLPPDARIAVADPDHVPAGIHAREAFDALDAGVPFESRIARADNVRGALWLVARGEAPLGVVYATDAAVSADVRVVGRFAASTHAPIEYVAAIPAGRDEALGGALLAFLASDATRAVLLRAGFTVPVAARAPQAGCTALPC